MKIVTSSYLCDGCEKSNTKEYPPSGWYIVESVYMPQTDCLQQQRGEIHACEDCGTLLRVWLLKLGIHFDCVPPKKNEMLPSERAWGRITVGVMPHEELTQDGTSHLAPAYYGVPIKLADGTTVQSVFELSEEDAARQGFGERR